MVSAGWDGVNHRESTHAVDSNESTHDLMTSLCRDGVNHRNHSSAGMVSTTGITPLQGWCRRQGINQRTWGGRQQPMTGWQHGVSSHCKKWWRRGHPLAVVLAHDPRPIPSRTASLVWYSMSYSMWYRSAPLVRSRPCLTEACSVWDGDVCGGMLVRKSCTLYRAYTFRLST